MYGEKEIIISGNSLKTKKNFSPIFITSSKNFSAISATFSLSKKKKNKEKETRRDELGGVLEEEEERLTVLDEIFLVWILPWDLIAMLFGLTQINLCAFFFLVLYHTKLPMSKRS